MGRQHPPKCRRAAVAHGGIVSEGKQSRHASSFEAEVAMADRVNAAMKTVEAPGAGAAGDCVVVNARGTQLAKAHDSVLARGNPGDQMVGIGGLFPDTGNKPQLRSLAPSWPVFGPFGRRPPAIQSRWPPTRRAYPVGAMAASAQYSVTVRVELDARQEPLGKLTAQIAEAGGSLVSVDLIPGAGPEGKRVREFTIDANSAEHWEQILRSIGSTRGARVLGFTDRTFEMHKKGKIEQHNKYPLKTRDDLSMAYTPGVARVCEYIAEDKTKAFDFTIKANTVAVVSDGSAVLGLGDIGPEAAMPVMEGKAMLFKEFAQVDAFPICLATNDPQEIIQTVKP